jgi:hypothetical protein
LSTRRAIRQRLLDETKSGFDSAASSGGAATTIPDTQYQDSNADSIGHKNQWLLRPAAALAVDRQRRIATRTIASGTWNHSGVNYTNSPANAEVYEVSQYFNYDELTEIIDRGLSRCWYEYWTPLSLIADWDMEASDTTSWTAATGATLSKVTTTGFRNARALRVQNDSTNDYAQSGSINAPSPVAYTAMAIVNITSGTAVLRPWDVTNSVAIANEVETAEFGQHILVAHFTTPASCRQFAIRLLGEEASADIVWDNLVVYRVGQRQYSLPSWITRRNQIVSVRAQTRAGLGMSVGTASDDSYDWPLLEYDIEADITGTVDLRLHLWGHPGTYPVWIQGKRPYAATADDNTTDVAINEDYAVAAAKVEFYKALLDRPGPKSEEMKANYARAIASFAAFDRSENPELPVPLRAVF